MSIGTRLKEWRAAKKLGQKEASTIFGISFRTYQNYELDHSPPGADSMRRFVDAGINANWLLSGNGSMFIGETESYSDREHQHFLPYLESSQMDDELEGKRHQFPSLPFYDADTPYFAEKSANRNQKTGQIAFSRAWLESKGAHEGVCALVKAGGDGMAPTIHNGDLLLIDTSVTSIKEDGIYLFYHEHYFARRAQWSLDGSLAIITDNPQYKDYILPPEQAKKSIAIGRVIWIGHEL